MQQPKPFNEETNTLANEDTPLKKGTLPTQAKVRFCYKGTFIPSIQIDKNKRSSERCGKISEEASHEGILNERFV